MQPAQTSQEGDCVPRAGSQAEVLQGRQFPERATLLPCQEEHLQGLWGYLREVPGTGPVSCVQIPSPGGASRVAALRKTHGANQIGRAHV